jgi:uncharacterized RDD family membrane protein YckC
MQRIDFKTSHNIVLNYPLASLGHRIGAFGIDIATVIFLQIILSMIFGFSTALMIIVTVIMYFFYQLMFEIFNGGQSPGKKLLKIRIVSLNGAIPSLRQYITRWIFKMLDILLSAGTMAISSILASNHGQRIGDVMAGTAVVSQDSGYPSLIKENTQHPKMAKADQNPLLARYNDDEMLIAKTLLNRFKTKPTDENYDLIIILADKISKDIKVTYDKYHVDVFMEKVLNDYIILTR